MADKCGAKVDPASVASRLAALITGNKWWLVTELSEHLQTSVGTIHSTLARNQKRFGIEHNRFYNGKAMVKEYRIKQNEL